MTAAAAECGRQDVVVGRAREEQNDGHKPAEDSQVAQDLVELKVVVREVVEGNVVVQEEEENGGEEGGRGDLDQREGAYGQPVEQIAEERQRDQLHGHVVPVLEHEQAACQHRYDLFLLQI